MQLVEDKTQEDRDEDFSKDIKWKNLTKNSLKSVKSQTELETLLKEVKEAKKDQMELVVTNQTTILSRLPWTTEQVEAWSTSGYITRLSRDSVDLYIDLLDRLVSLGRYGSWSLAETELAHFVRKLGFLRVNCPTRIAALVKIYIFMMESSSKSWRMP